MLVDIPLNTLDRADAALFAGVAEMMGHTTEVKHIGRGLYELGHWNFDEYLGEGWIKSIWGAPEEARVINWNAQFPWEAELSTYGVCDSPEQFMRKMGELFESHPCEFVVAFVRLDKENQSPIGGWRWHKWGPYIGEQTPVCEYLYDEPTIETVYTYQWFARRRESI